MEPCYPSRCPHQPISIPCAAPSRPSIRETRPLTSILMLRRPHRPRQVCLPTWWRRRWTRRRLQHLGGGTAAAGGVLFFFWPQTQSCSALACAAAKPLVRLFARRPALTAVFVCDMQMSHLPPPQPHPPPSPTPLLPFFLSFFPSFFFGWRLMQGVGKGVCLL